MSDDAQVREVVEEVVEEVEEEVWEEVREGAGDEDEDAGGRRLPGPALVLTAAELTLLEAAHVRGLATHAPETHLAGEETIGDTVLAGGGATDAGEPDDGPTGRGPTAGALGQARWSLVARGLLSSDGRLPEDTDLGLLLQTLLDVRLAAEALVVVERLVGEGRRDVRLLHLLPQGGVVEDVYPEGLHGLDLMLSGARLVTAVTEMLVPADATGGDGPQVIADLPERSAPGEASGLWTRLPALLHHPTVLAEVTMVRPQQEAVGHLVALGPRGCWAGPTPTARGLLRLSPVEPEWIGELMTSWVQEVVGAPGEGTMSG